MESLGCLGDRNFGDRGDGDSVFGRPERILVLAILGLAVVVSPVATIDLRVTWQAAAKTRTVSSRPSRR